MKNNRNLAIAACVLLLLSILVYRNSLVRAERFERGAHFLPNLNPDDIATLTVTKGDDVVTLKRADDAFVITNAEGYPAKNEAVNRLIRNILDIKLEKEIGDSDSLYEELSLLPDSKDATVVEIKNEADKPMVRFVVGANLEGGSGSFVRRLDGNDSTVYLTTQNTYLTTGTAGYLDKEILDVKGSEVAAISGRDFTMSLRDDELKLDKVPNGWEEKVSGINRVKGVLSYLNFDEVYLADDQAVQGLRFRQVMQVDLKDDTGYRLSLAENGDDKYLQISGFHNIQRLTVGQDESEEDLQKKADIMSRANEIQEFNAFHGSWVYKISQATYDKIAIDKSELMQKKS